jgi:hypothetical protein
MDPEFLKDSITNRNPDRPENYKKAIFRAQTKYNIVLVPQSILITLRKDDIPYSLVVPTIDCKDEYIARMEKRGNNISCISKMKIHFEEYLNNRHNDTYAQHIYLLQKREYLSDLLQVLNS